MPFWNCAVMEASDPHVSKFEIVQHFRGSFPSVHRNQSLSVAETDEKCSMWRCHVVVLLDHMDPPALRAELTRCASPVSRNTAWRPTIRPLKPRYHRQIESGSDGAASGRCCDRCHWGTRRWGCRCPAVLDQDGFVQSQGMPVPPTLSSCPQEASRL